MDAQRKLSELQTEYKEKELHYEEELQSQEVLFGNQLAVETAEKKRLAKELVSISMVTFSEYLSYHCSLSIRRF